MTPRARLHTVILSHPLPPLECGKQDPWTREMGFLKSLHEASDGSTSERGATDMEVWDLPWEPGHCPVDKRNGFGQIP